MGIAFSAMNFAREKHKDQKRKYTGDPYADHLAEVAGIVATVTTWDAIEPEAMIAVAWLHDVMEDQGVQQRELIEILEGSISSVEQVVRGVRWLSDLEIGNRAERKAASRNRLAHAPGWVQTIKCADLISNTGSIVQHDPKFAKVYLEEKRLLLDVLIAADKRLLALARKQIA